MQFLLIGLSLLVSTLAVDVERAKRQFFEVEESIPEVTPQLTAVPQYSRLVYRAQPAPKYKLVPVPIDSKWAVDPFYPSLSSLSSPLIAQRPMYYQPMEVVHTRPVYRKLPKVQYAPVRTIYRARPMIVERPMATVIEKPLKVYASSTVLVHPPPPNTLLLELEKKKRKMAKQ